MPEPKTESEAELTWAQAWNNAPGPKSMREALTLFGKGLAMGTADIIPGVSGGTIAFITGIYHHLLSAISSINLSSIWLGLQGKFKEALVEIHLRFLIVLFGGIFPWAASGRSLALGRDEGMTKVIFDEHTDQILGVAIVGPNAGDLIAEGALAIEMGCDASDIGSTIHPHPTLSETFAMAAEAFEGTITDLYMPKKKSKTPSKAA